MSTKESDLLRQAASAGIIKFEDIRLAVEAMRKEEILKRHTYRIWQGKDGYWYTYLPDKDGRKLVKKSTKEKLDDAIYAYYKDQIDKPTIDAVFHTWIDDKLKFGEIQKQSYDRYQTDYLRFFVNNESFKNFHQTKIQDVMEEDLEEFIKLTIVEMELTQKAYSGMRTLINGIFKYAKKKSYTDISITNFMGDLELSRRSFKKNVKDKEDEVYQEMEAKRLTDYLSAQDNDIRCLGLLLIFETGMRAGELCALKPEDIGKGYIHVKRTEVKYRNSEEKWVHEVKDYPKSDAGERYIVINENAVQTIAKIMKIRPQGDYLFMDGNKRIKSQAFRRKLARVCGTLDIKYKSNHKIRKTYGTMLIDSGVDESIIAEQMGHVDISTTKKYYYFSNKSQEKKREQISKAISF